MYAYDQFLLMRSCCLSTLLSPSMKLTLSRTLALLNMPYFREIMMNCDCGKRWLIIEPMFSVCDWSSAESISSRM